MPFKLNATTGLLDLVSSAPDLSAYWKNDGTSTATGNWNLGSHNLTTTGTLGAGATTVTSLNATTLPTGTLITPPSGLNIGDVWMDTTTSAQYPILRIRKT